MFEQDTLTLTLHLYETHPHTHTWIRNKQYSNTFYFVLFFLCLAYKVFCFMLSCCEFSFVCIVHILCAVNCGTTLEVLFLTKPRENKTGNSSSIKVISTETFNVNFPSKQINQIWIILFFSIFFICLVGRMSAKGLGDRGWILGLAIPKTQKMILIPPCLTFSILRYVSRVKWSNQGKGVAPSPTPRCSS